MGRLIISQTSQSPLAGDVRGECLFVNQRWDCISLSSRCCPVVLLKKWLTSSPSTSSSSTSSSSKTIIALFVRTIALNIDLIRSPQRRQLTAVQCSCQAAFGPTSHLVTMRLLGSLAGRSTRRRLLHHDADCHLLSLPFCLRVCIDLNVHSRRQPQPHSHVPTHAVTAAAAASVDPESITSVVFLPSPVHFALRAYSSHSHCLTVLLLCTQDPWVTVKSTALHINSKNNSSSTVSI